MTLVSIGFYVSGGLCIFKTKMVAGWGQKSYKTNQWVRAYPFSNVVMKPWYPILIRCSGIFICLWALAFDCLILFRGFR